MTQADLIEVTMQYQAYVVAALPGLVAEVTTLSADIATGHLAQAKADWLVGHLSYERLGAAYDAFGDADGEINPTAQGRPGGVLDQDFVGFHRIEYGLWNGQSAGELAPIAADLVAAVSGLQTSFPTHQVDPLLISLRAHEIVENALQFELTGQSDYGSHTNLATARANLDGANELITLLHPLLQPRYAQDNQLAAEMTKTISDLNPLLGEDVATLPLAQREGVNSDFSELSELLAPVASILEPRRVQ